MGPPATEWEIGAAGPIHARGAAAPRGGAPTRRGVVQNSRRTRPGWRLRRARGGGPVPSHHGPLVWIPRGEHARRSRPAPSARRPRRPGPSAPVPYACSRPGPHAPDPPPCSRLPRLSHHTAGLSGRARAPLPHGAPLDRPAEEATDEEPSAKRPKSAATASSEAAALGYELGTIKHAAYILLSRAGSAGLTVSYIVELATKARAPGSPPPPPRSFTLPAP